MASKRFGASPSSRPGRAGCAFGVPITLREVLDIPRERILKGWNPLFLFSRVVKGGTSLRVQDNKQKVRVNDQIRISPVRLVGDDGQQVGVVPIEEAKQLARERGLDLVEVAPLARPPVVKLMDYGKYRFDQAKAARAAKKKQHTMQVKEVNYRPGISGHDFDFKTRHARVFLEEGNKVKLTMMFRGRQITHPELGLEVLHRVYELLEDVAKIEMKPKLEGRNMTMVLAPR